MATLNSLRRGISIFGLNEGSSSVFCKLLTHFGDCIATIECDGPQWHKKGAQKLDSYHKGLNEKQVVWALKKY